jgi:histidinol dehydrogenase
LALSDVSLLRLYDVATARRTILRRVPPDVMDVPEAVLDGIEEKFGERLMPEQAVARILADVRERGDAALRDWTRRLDGVDLGEIAVPSIALEAALKRVPPERVEALELAIERVRAFHAKQPLTSWLDATPGGSLGQMVRPVERVGVYVPAGSAPLPSSLLMSAVPAQVAGVERIVVCAPPGADGEIAPIILATAAIVGVDAIYRLGGAQAIAAMAYGSESVPRVDKIVGPGNLFVTLAKRQVFGAVGIDGLPGPTETMVIADERADPGLAAADLLAQAEHDVLASAILLTPSKPLAEAVARQIARQMEDLSRAEIIAASLADRGGAVITRDLDEAFDLANDYAAEHLCLLVADPWAWLGRVRNAGGVFLGESSFEVLGDYVAGPSHVMPTGGTARFASPLNVLDFVKITSVIGLAGESARQLSRAAATLAEAESLTAHAAAARARVEEPTE